MGSISIHSRMALQRGGCSAIFYTVKANLFVLSTSKRVLPSRPKSSSFLFQGNVVFGLELARRYGDQGIVSIVLNPGNIESDLLRNLSSIQRYLTAGLSPHYSFAISH